MKIVDIFAPALFSFHYDGEVDNEYDRLMDNWTDVNYLRKYAKSNGIENVNQFVRERLKDAEQIQDLLEEIITNKQPLEFYFRTLFDTESGIKTLSLQKGKIDKNGIRIYAIKIDKDCFVITGGAIKMSQTMQGHPDSNNELMKIKDAKNYLQENSVIDEDSFYELINEQNEQ
ncbi:DUF479 domain-containing protein [Flavobacterium sp. ANB]|uniref:ACP phosphodiesterase n=1 Tax=unclassified Flavobacterium TaxID=196869 RepID=UPI0012B78C60|nr:MULTISPECIES: ACP phosphodiesterase [unclassified Flavobacterium]MBF4515582.1 DUF479 domain-containing protein [Flavobacterium sp. ANB]MTD68585.1 DUF479 domain-containing protein [Flavobacterium sp. LC2016-13]